MFFWRTKEREESLLPISERRLRTALQNIVHLHNQYTHAPLSCQAFFAHSVEFSGDAFLAPFLPVMYLTDWPLAQFFA